VAAGVVRQGVGGGVLVEGVVACKSIGGECPTGQARRFALQEVTGLREAAACLVPFPGSHVDDSRRCTGGSLKPSP
jgi:hypothetical protein